MLPLQSRIEAQNWAVSAPLKIAGLADFASSAIPFDRMILDLREPGGQARSAELCSLPWAGFLADSLDDAPKGRPGIRLTEDSAIVRPGDVVEVRRDSQSLAVRYRRGDNGNVLFATERCNSYCLMCSQPPREVEDNWRVEHLCLLVELIDKGEPSLAISGGEPTLLGSGLNRIVGHCAASLPSTHIHILSNGRLLGEPRYAQSFSGLHPSLSWGIPLYGDTFQLHDYVVQSAGAFSQTVRGLYALQAANQRIEVRVVLVRPTVERLLSLVRYIYRNLPFVDHVALMGIEPIGFAKAHHEELWIDPADMAETLSEAVGFLTGRGMGTSLYNLPLCVLPRPLWRFARRSISNWKQTYLAACRDCAVRDQCGGFFAWVSKPWLSRAMAPIEEQVHA